MIEDILLQSTTSPLFIRIVSEFNILDFLSDSGIALFAIIFSLGTYFHTRYLLKRFERPIISIKKIDAEFNRVSYMVSKEKPRETKFLDEVVYKINFQNIGKHPVADLVARASIFIGELVQSSENKFANTIDINSEKTLEFPIKIKQDDRKNDIEIILDFEYKDVLRIKKVVKSSHYLISKTSDNYEVRDATVEEKLVMLDKLKKNEIF